MYVYGNGDIYESNRFKELFEPGYLFGWGVFETMRVYKRTTPFLSQHISRLDASLARLGIEPVNVDFEQIIKDLLSKNWLDDAYVRITVYRRRQESGVLVYMDEFTYYPPESYEKGFSGIVAAQPVDTQSLSWQVKSLSYLEKRMAWLQAQQQKQDEALVANRQGHIIGGSRSNLVLFKKGEALVPAVSDGIFEGITRGAVLQILKGLQIPVKEVELSLGDFADCDEAFLTSSLLKVMPLVQCHSTPIGSGKPGELTKQILTEYNKQING